MTKAIIFDCFGVLTTEGWADFRDKHFGDRPEVLAEVMDLNRRADDGEIDYEWYISKVARLAGVTGTELHNHIEKVAPNERLLEYIHGNLKPKYDLGILSNVPADWLESIFSREQLADFGATLLSYEIGVTKPHPESYLTIAKRLGVEPADCVFVDDSKANCEGAERVGMQAIHYQTFEQFCDELALTIGH